jgi:hypothetical protein
MFAATGGSGQNTWQQQPPQMQVTTQLQPSWQQHTPTPNPGGPTAPFKQTGPGPLKHAAGTPGAKGHDAVRVLPPPPAKAGLAPVVPGQRTLPPPPPGVQQQPAPPIVQQVQPLQQQQIEARKRQEQELAAQQEQVRQLEAARKRQQEESRVQLLQEQRRLEEQKKQEVCSVQVFVFGR